jgi:hypothetical protein
VLVGVLYSADDVANQKQNESVCIVALALARHAARVCSEACCKVTASLSLQRRADTRTHENDAGCSSSSARAAIAKLCSLLPSPVVCR